MARGERDPNRSLQGLRPLPRKGRLPVAGGSEQENRPRIGVVEQLDQPRTLDDPSFSASALGCDALAVMPACPRRGRRSPVVKQYAFGAEMKRGLAPAAEGDRSGRRFAVSPRCRLWPTRGSLPAGRRRSEADTQAGSVAVAVPRASDAACRSAPSPSAARCRAPDPSSSFDRPSAISWITSRCRVGDRRMDLSVPA